VESGRGVPQGLGGALKEGEESHQQKKTNKKLTGSATASWSPGRFLTGGRTKTRSARRGRTTAPAGGPGDERAFHPIVTDVEGAAARGSCRRRWHGAPRSAKKDLKVGRGGDESYPGTAAKAFEGRGLFAAGRWFAAACAVLIKWSASRHRGCPGSVPENFLRGHGPRRPKGRSRDPRT